MEPFFLEGQAGNLFAVYHAPGDDRPAAPAVLLVPPFAEELNRSRHMMAAAARALSGVGVAVLIIDLYGTGDSEGRFDEARWEIWRNDLESAALWLEGRGHAVTGVLAVRLGALLALDWLKATGRTPEYLIFWGAVTGGAQYLNQFLRLRVAESMARTDGTKETTSDLKALIDAGETVEVGGYGLTKALTEAIEGLKAADLTPPEGCAVHWLDVAAEAGAPLSPGADRVVTAWQEAGASVNSTIVPGPAFWSLQEPEHAPALVDATVKAFMGERS